MEKLNHFNPAGHLGLKYLVLVASLLAALTVQASQCDGLSGPPSTLTEPSGVLHYIETNVNLMRPAQIWIRTQRTGSRPVSTDCIEGYISLPTPDERKAALEENRNPLLKVDLIQGGTIHLNLESIEFIQGDEPWSRR